ncbi:MAG: C4-dicarboxylate ABC transporter [Planctomycetota bacterium]|nr:MAG: C4-dicarboxylate ABC transporter [Planctomycetota bacterium]
MVRQAVWGALGLAVLAALAPVPAEAQRRGRRGAEELKLALLAPEGTSWARLMHEFDAELRRRSGEALGLRLYLGGVQGDEKVVLRKIKVGQLHGGAFTGMGMGEIVSEVRALELPFQYDSYAQVDHVRQRLDARLRERFRAGGYELLGWFELGFVHLFSTRPIRTVQDVRSAKPWVWEGDPLAEAYFKAFEVSPTPLPLPDVLTSLQTGLIDTVYQSPMACVGFQWYTKLSYMSDLPLACATGGLLLKRSVFERLPREHQELLRELGEQYSARVIQLTREENEAAKQTLQEHGIRIVPFDAAESATFREYGKQVSYQLAGEGTGKLFPRALLDEVYAWLAETRDKAGAD